MTTSSTPLPSPCSPTGSAYLLGWWWEPQSRGPADPGSDVHAWMEIRIADGVIANTATERFMGDRPPTSRFHRHLRRGCPGTRLATRADAAGEEGRRTRPNGPRTSGAAGRSGRPRRLVVAPAPTRGPDGRRPSASASGAAARASDRMGAASTKLVDHARDLGIPVKVHRSRPARAHVLARAAPCPGRGTTVSSPSRAVEGGGEGLLGQVMRERGQLGGSQPTAPPGVGAVQPHEPHPPPRRGLTFGRWYPLD